ncbi:TrkA family potassium uptake protein [Mycoplasma sp. NEAQ87857]|uniref:potassium channel family protein n=1 Tax=Mycoplasma sp. NEAQ87857 TaxID=2683967 RepID=UPI001318946C|nr:TrkA family potassium uptake protein [Mycoplasma sp. NEAQ87857]QGZ97565.1 TrkA family potassium uptake protein [Mycoplasma sp. NEAQ87857]
MKMKYRDDIAVIGVGRFGQAVIDQLLKMDKNVLIIDQNDENAKLYEQEAERIVIADAADMRALKAIGIAQIETVVVAISDNIEIIAALLELKVKNIIARAKSRRHARVLKQIGVHVIINPETEAGVRTALIAANKNFVRYSEGIQEISENFVIGNTTIKNSSLTNQPISKLGFNDRGITIVLIKRNGVPKRATGQVQLEIDDIVTLIGEINDVTDALKWCNDTKSA